MKILRDAYDRATIRNLIKMSGGADLSITYDGLALDGPLISGNFSIALCRNSVFGCLHLGSGIGLEIGPASSMGVGAGLLSFRVL